MNSTLQSIYRRYPKGPNKWFGIDGRWHQNPDKAAHMNPTLAATWMPVLQSRMKKGQSISLYPSDQIGRYK